jgi:hypothetical protein
MFINSNLKKERLLKLHCFLYWIDCTQYFIWAAMVIMKLKINFLFFSTNFICIFKTGNFSLLWESGYYFMRADKVLANNRWK